MLGPVFMYIIEALAITLFLRGVVTIAYLIWLSRVD
jgi:hypothetical protein